MKKKICALLFRIIAVVLSIIGITFLFIVDNKPVRQLYYFTMQTNFFILFMMIVLVVKTFVQIVKKEKCEVAHLNCALQLALVFYITITFLGYAILLSSTAFSMVSNDYMGIKLIVANILVHYIVPIMAIIDWIVFMPHKKVGYKKIGLFLSYPIFYLLLISLRAVIDDTKIFVVGKNELSRFPYPFVDFDKLGYWSILSVLGLTVVFVLLGILFIWIDKKLPNVKTKEVERHLYGNEV